MKIKLDAGAYVPERAHEADAGYDLRSPVTGRLYAGQAVVIDTGVHVEIPRGYVDEVQRQCNIATVAEEVDLW